MPPGEPRHDWKAMILVAAAIVAGRLPFLLHASRFFDSDEAVEGLMARHVLAGEFPFYLWGQRYKGVPEVYLSAAAFHFWPAAASPGAGNVIALKTVTLLGFALYACLDFRLLTKLFSRRVAWIATAFLIAGPPSLVFWSLSGSAEIVMTLLAGTSLLLGLSAWRRSGSRAGLVMAGVSLGLGLWIQQYVLYYVAAAALAAIDWSPQGRARIRDFASAADLPGWLRWPIHILAAVASLYFMLGLAAFFGLGFDVRPAGVAITVTHPQKMWWIAAGLLSIAGALLTIGRVARRHTRSWLAPALGFLAGLAPAIAGRLVAHGYGAPTARMDAAGLASAFPSFAGVALPIVFGFRSPTTERLASPSWLALVVACTVVLSYARLLRTKPDEQRPLFRVFHISLILTPLVFVGSGAYIDAQSYRYLMLLHAALPVVYAVGIDSAWRMNRIAGVALLAALVSIHGLQQLDWYRRLEPDREAQTIVGCLERGGIRAAWGDYWLSYKLTFLTGERVIVAPTSGVDRYPPYTALVRSQPSSPTIERLPPGAANTSCGTLIRFEKP
jgi:hypothetical protein